MTTDLGLSLGWAAVDWMEHYLVHGPGDVQGQRIELDDEFAEFIVRAYLVDKSGARLVRRAFLSRAKGRSKSGLAAFIGDFEALGPCRFDHWAEVGEVSDWGYEYEEGEPVGKPLAYVEALCVATEESQAGNTYDAIYYTLHPDTCSPELLADYGRLDVGLTRINLPNKRGYIEPVTSADTSKDGGKSTFIVADETHLWVLPRLHRLHGVMTRNLLKRKEASGWMLETSTMYAEGEGSVAEGTHAYAESSARSRKSLLFDHRQASEDWNLDARRERVKALREAYGPAAAWMNLEAIADSWDDPQVSEADFRRFWLNQPVPLTEPAPSIFPNWPALADASKPGSVAAIGVAFDVDQEVCSISSISGDDLPVIDLLHHERKGPWIIPVVKALHAAGAVIVVGGKGPAETWIPLFEAEGVKVEPFAYPDLVQASSDFDNAVDQMTVRHANDDRLNGSVQGAEWRMNSDRRVLRRSKFSGPWEAATLALWGANQPVGSGFNIW